MCPRTFTVTKDVDDGTAGTFRWAIDSANGAAGADTIDFNINNCTEPHTILLDPNRGQLPSITEAVFIDGFSQKGAATDGAPWVEIDGNDIAGTGLRLTAGDSTVRGLAITGFNGDGISIANPVGSVGCEVYGCYIGVDMDGVTKEANTGNGIVVTGANNVVGDDGGGLFVNVISGNGGDGVRITGAGATHNVVCLNYIGVNETGLVALANVGHGVVIDAGANSNTIGSPGFVDLGNVISGNGKDGIRLDSTNHNSFIDNYIGLGVDGVTAVGNAWHGVRMLTAATNNQFLGLNVISSNGQHGIMLSGVGVTGNKIYGAYIGTTKNGDVARGNLQRGVNIDNATGNWVGGTAAGQGNVISGNKSDGVGIIGAQATQNYVAGNLIGLKADGMEALKNEGNGVEITGSNNTIGFADETVSNVISGNVGNGIRIQGSFNVVANNYIGTNQAGNAKVANEKDGVRIDVGSQDNTIGGTAENTGNVISGNAEYGVSIQGSGDGTNTTRNTVAGNYIGLKANGLEAMGNGLSGVYMQRASGNTVGGATSAARNYIAGNGTIPNEDGYGVELSVGATGNLVNWNSVGKNTQGNVVANKSGWKRDFTGNNTWGDDNEHD